MSALPNADTRNRYVFDGSSGACSVFAVVKPRTYIIGTRAHNTTPERKYKDHWDINIKTQPPLHFRPEWYTNTHVNTSTRYHANGGYNVDRGEPAATPKKSNLQCRHGKSVDFTVCSKLKTFPRTQHPKTQRKASKSWSCFYPIWYVLCAATVEATFDESKCGRKQHRVPIANSASPSRTCRHQYDLTLTRGLPCHQQERSPCS